MGAVNFDPEAWRAEFLAGDGSSAPAKAAKPAKVEGVEAPTFATFATFASQPPSPLQEMTSGIARLRRMDRPRITRPDMWRGIVEDAERLLARGWVEQALAMGWEPLHLLGVDPGPDPEWHDCSLAAWLNGRSVAVVLDDAIIIRTDDRRVAFNKRARPGLSRYLWELR